MVELARRDFLKHAGILIYQDCPYRGERAAGCGEQLGWNPLGSGNWDARSEELRKYMADSMWLGGPPPAAMMGTIADCTLRTCKPLADELTRRGLYALRPASGCGQQTAIAVSEPHSQNPVQSINSSSAQLGTAGYVALAGGSSSVIKALTRAAISSRMARTVARGWPAGSGSFQSR